MQDTILINGGGIGGLCTAIALHKKGYPVHVFEKAAPLRALGAGLVLAANAMKALDEIGIGDAVRKIGREIERMELKDQNGLAISGSDFSILGAYGKSYAVHRAELHETLIRLLPEGILSEGMAGASFTTDQNGVCLEMLDGRTSHGQLLIAADGIHSPIRKTLLPNSQARYAGYTCWRAVIQLPAGQTFLQESSESWGSNGRFGLVPLTGNRIYWFATHNAPANSPEMAAIKVADLQALFADYHAPIPEVLSMTKDEDLLWHDILDIAPIDRFSFPGVVLLGDAAHATTPNMGQGACMAIEDAATIANCLTQYGLTEGPRRFEALRLRRTHRIVRQSWQFGKMSQMESKWLSAIRNQLLRLTPERMAQQQLRWLFQVDLGSEIQ
ncbi:MAG: FAD-dependent monooxygenase [Bacteroidota bacterium]